MILNTKYDPKKRKKYAEHLGNWSYLCPVLPTITDETYLLELLDYELRHARRMHMLTRIYSRFNTVRREREQLQLEEKANEISRAKTGQR